MTAAVRLAPMRPNPSRRAVESVEAQEVRFWSQVLHILKAKVAIKVILEVRSMNQVQKTWRSMLSGANVGIRRRANHYPRAR